MDLTFCRNLSVSGLRNNILFFGVFVALLLFSQDVVLGDDSFKGTTTFHRQALSGLRNGKGFTVSNTPVLDLSPLNKNISAVPLVNAADSSGQFCFARSH